MYPGEPQVLTMNVDTVASFTNAIDVFQINNMTDGCIVSFNLGGGTLILDSSCVGGEIDVFGIGTLEDNSSGMTIDDSALVDGSGGVDIDVLVDAVWDEAIAAHLLPGTTGEKLSNSGTGDPAAIADAVWDEAADEHTLDGTMGELENKLGSIDLAKPKIVPGD